IVRCMKGTDPAMMPAVLVGGHAPFCWGVTPGEAAHNAWMLEEVAYMATMTLALNPEGIPLSPTMQDKHFLRKHGPAASYGQKPRNYYSLETTLPRKE